MQAQRYHKQAGLTLIEGALVLALFLSIAAVAISTGVDLGGSTEVQGQKTKLNTIINNTKSLYENRADYAGLDQATAVDAQIFPQEMVSGGTALNTWSGNVTVAAAADTSGNADRAFEVVWGNTPEAQCTAMASGTVADQVSIGGTVVTDAQGTVDPGLAAPECAGGPADITFLVEK